MISCWYVKDKDGTSLGLFPEKDYAQQFSNQINNSIIKESIIEDSVFDYQYHNSLFMRMLEEWKWNYHTIY